METLRQKQKEYHAQVNTVNRLQKWSGFRDHELNYHETHRYTDSEICSQRCKPSVRKKIGSDQLSEFANQQSYFAFAHQYLSVADKPLRNRIRFTDKNVDMNTVI